MKMNEFNSYENEEALGPKPELLGLVNREDNENKLLKAPKQSYSEDKFDILLRVTGDYKDSKVMGWEDTDAVQFMFETIFNTFTEIIQNLRKQIEYNGYYFSFLLGQISKKKFIKISKKYMFQKKDIPLNLLEQKINYFHNFISDDITIKDMSYLFECAEEDIIKARKLSNV